MHEEDFQNAFCSKFIIFRKRKRQKEITHKKSTHFIENINHFIKTCQSVGCEILNKIA